MDSDRILVMQEGRVAVGNNLLQSSLIQLTQCLQEIGDPYELLADPEGVLSELADNTGEGNKQKLMSIAKTHYFYKISKDVF